MRILITNWTMEELGGASLFVRELAIELARRGHEPAVYSPRIGAMAQPITDAGVPVAGLLDELDDFEPDVIHAQHHLETTTALLRFPRAPAVFLSHGSLPQQELPVAFPRILRYLAVSETARWRAAETLGVEAQRIELFPNWVDLDRFRPRGPLPVRPRRALMLGNNFTAHNGLGTLREACAACGVELDARGGGVADPVDRPEEILGDYDLVFGLGRVALEGAACGCAVILCHPDGVGPLLAEENLEDLRALNFGWGALNSPLQTAALVERIRRFDPAKASAVSGKVRAIASIGPGVDRLVDIYRQVRTEFRQSEPPSSDQELRAVSAYLSNHASALVTYADAARRRESDLHLDSLRRYAADLEERIREMEASLTWRTGKTLARLPGLGALARRFSS